MTPSPDSGERSEPPVAPPLMPPVTSNLRAVLHLTRGVSVLMGRYVPSAHAIKDFITVEINGAQVQASLIKVTPRMIVYREISEGPITGKLGEFHPDQR